MIIEKRIETDPELCHGKPRIKGTRIMISVILEWLEAGKTFDEKLGGKYLGEQFLEIGGRKYSEIAYGWENIKVILSNF